MAPTSATDPAAVAVPAAEVAGSLVDWIDRGSPP
jgi:hypothetical protein